MKYQVMFAINRGSRMISFTVETSRPTPDLLVIRHSELLVDCSVLERMESSSAEGLKALVYKDRCDFFTFKPPVPEQDVIAWIQAGMGVFGKEYQKLFANNN